MRPLIGSLLLLCTLQSISGEIYEYSHLQLDYDHIIYRESGMYSPSDVQSHSPGNGRSFISLTDLHFARDNDANCRVPAQNDPACGTVEGLVDILIFERGRFDEIGMSVADSRYYCCTSDAVAAGACSEANMNSLIAHPYGPGHMFIRHLKVPLTGSSALATPMDGEFDIPISGMYIVLIANCDPSNGTLRLDGHTVWMNPYGYLPGEGYGNLPYFKLLSIIYIFIAVVWYSLCYVALKHLHPIHLWTSAVLLLGMIETTAKYYGYWEWNTSGTFHSGVMSWGLVFGVTKRALSRILVLMFCLGYGAVRPTLGNDLKTVLGLGAGFWAANAGYELLESASASHTVIGDEASLDIALMLVMLSSMIDVLICLWALQSLMALIKLLKLKRQGDRASLYVKFGFVLAVGVAFSAAWSLYGIVQSTGDRMETNWQQDWSVQAIWEVLYLYLLLSVCVLLRPHLDGQHSFTFSSVEKPGAEDDSRLMDDQDEFEYGGRQHLNSGDGMEVAMVNLGGETTNRDGPVPLKLGKHVD